jgi:hypothetical protein
VRYQIYDFALDTGEALPELAAARTLPSDRDIALRVRAARPQASPAAWFFDWRLPDGTVWARAGRFEQSLLLRFTAMADFVVAADGATVEVFPVPAVPAVTLRHLFLDQVLPLVVSHRGDLVLHASAVAVADGAVAFLGQGGAGKSTLAASFWAHGHPLVADDAVLVSRKGAGVVALAGYAGLRLWPDVLDVVREHDRPSAEGGVAHYTQKRRLGGQGQAARFQTGPIPLCALYVLTDPKSGVTLATPTPRDALMTIVRHAYRLDVTDRARLAAQLDRIAGVLPDVPVRLLSCPRTLESLHEVRRTILADVGSIAASPAAGARP